MEHLARYVVDAVVLEKRSYRQVALDHGVSKSWVAKLVARYRDGGYDAIKPRSKAPKTIPNKTPTELEDQVVALRGELEKQGYDNGAATINYHLGLSMPSPPSISTIWRILKRRGLIVAEPHKRPKSSWKRFESALPNECWQSDVTMYGLKDGSAVEIINYLDDFSRVVVASRVVETTTTQLVLSTFRKAGQMWGFPQEVLTDNGRVYTTHLAGGCNAMQMELYRRGIKFKHSRPNHPTTCGKVERFHQTLKNFLDKQPRAASMDELQKQVDRFVAYYNQVRPHRAKGRMTPLTAFSSRAKAGPIGPKLDIGPEVRVRNDRVDKEGKVTLRHNGKMHHIGVGRDHKGKRVVILMSALDLRVLTQDGELLRRLTFDPNKDYQPTGRPPGPPKGRPLGKRKKKVSTMP